MKKIKILALTFLIFMYGANAQNKFYNTSSNYYTDADYRSALDYNEVKDMLAVDGYIIADERVANLKEGETAYSYKTFYASLDYIIVAISNDLNVSDIDLHVYSSGSEYTSDTKPNAVSIVHIYPYYERNMEVVIKNAGSDEPYDASSCRYVIAYKKR